MLESFTAKTFEPLTGTTFRVRLDSGDVDLTLKTLEVLKSPGEAFSLRFDGPLAPFLGQGTRQMEHASLGSFPLFMTPIGSNPEGYTYEAIFNRLPPSPAGGTPRP